jgi:hypothetical protein
VCRYWIAGSGNSAGMTSVASGATVGGEMGGIWTCGEPPGATWQYKCTTAAAKDAGCTL